MLKHAEHAAFSDHLHRVMQEKIGQLLIRQRTMGSFVTLVAALRPRRAELGLERRISRDHTDGLLYQGLLLGLKETGMMQGLSRQRGEEFDAGSDRFGLQSVAERQAQTESGKFYRAFLQIDAVDFFEQPLENPYPRPLPFIAASPVQYQALVGFHEKNARAAGGIEDDFVLLLQAVEPVPAQRFVQHQPHQERRGINRNWRSHLRKAGRCG